MTSSFTDVLSRSRKLLKNCQNLVHFKISGIEEDCLKHIIPIIKCLKNLKYVQFSLQEEGVKYSEFFP